MNHLLQIPVEQDQKNYQTSDLGCASALLCLNFEITHLDKTNPRRVLFVFLPKKGIQETTNAYWNNALDVKAQSYFNAMKNLKSQIYSNHN